MQKPLEQIQQENRKFILEAIHGCSYEEALEKELSVGCKVIDKTHVFFGEPSPVEMTLVYGNAVDGEESDPLYFLHLRGNPCVSFSKQVIFDKDRFEIIGKPLTLSRVLLALKDKEIGFYNDCLGEIWEIASGVYRGNPIEYICDWNLALGEIELTLEEQTEETQRGLNKLFNNIEKRNNK